MTLITAVASEWLMVADGKSTWDSTTIQNTKVKILKFNWWFLGIAWLAIGIEIVKDTITKSKPKDLAELRWELTKHEKAKLITSQSDDTKLNINFIYLTKKNKIILCDNYWYTYQSEQDIEAIWYPEIIYGASHYLKHFKWISLLQELEDLYRHISKKYHGIWELYTVEYLKQPHPLSSKKK